MQRLTIQGATSFEKETDSEPSAMTTWTAAPQCGFSRKICDILNSIDGVSYDAFNILADNEVREGLKTYSDWPTYPQLYVDGELIGGLDIVREMYENGELTDLLQS